MKMYNYFSQKLEAFWIKRKWFIVGAVVIVALIGVFLELKNSPKAKVKNALSALNSGAEITLLELRPVAATFPDSLRRKAAFARYDKFKKEFDFWVGSSSFKSDEMRDSCNAALGVAERINAKIEANKIAGRPLTFCRYVASRSDGVILTSDTLTAVIDSSFTVVWPDKK